MPPCIIDDRLEHEGFVSRTVVSRATIIFIHAILRCRTLPRSERIIAHGRPRVGASGHCRSEAQGADSSHEPRDPPDLHRLLHSTTAPQWSPGAYAACKGLKHLTLPGAVCCSWCGVTP